MAIRDFLSKALTKDEDFKQAERELKIRRTLEQRQKNSDERELERFQEEARQRQIREELQRFREERNKEAMKTSVLNQDHDILKDKKLFSLKSNNLNGGGMFFK